MEVWLEIVVRQIILYSLPVLISLSLIGMLEASLRKEPLPHPFHAIVWKSAWWPLLASIALQRAVIIALPQPLQWNLRGAWIRFLGHLAGVAIGFLLYQWSWQHQPSVGLPPLHHWWAKVTMYFNLCMLAMHALPMPGMLLGECLGRCGWLPLYAHAWLRRHQHILWTIVAALPLLDLSYGAGIVFPIYRQLTTWAMH